MGTTIIHPMPDPFKPPFVIFDIRTPCQSVWMWKITNGDNPVWHGVLFSWSHMAAVGVKGSSSLSMKIVART